MTIKKCKEAYPDCVIHPCQEKWGKRINKDSIKKKLVVFRALTKNVYQSVFMKHPVLTSVLKYIFVIN